MKKFYFFVLLLMASLASFAGGTSYNVRQNGWRFRNNDGSETAASWKAAQQTSINYSLGEVLRLRIELLNTSVTVNTTCQFPPCTNTPTSIPQLDSLQYSTVPLDEASWQNIGLDFSKHFVLAGSNGFISQDEATTAQITGSSLAFFPGKIMLIDSVSKNLTIPGNRRSEFEWSIKSTSNALPSTTYYFRQRRRYSTTATTVYATAFPSLQTGTFTAVSNLSANTVLVSVSPNPVRGMVRFTIGSSTTKVVHTLLSDATGQMIHQQDFRGIQANAVQTLTTPQPLMPGVYILTISGDKISTSVKVLVP